MSVIYDKKAPKKPSNLSVNSDLLKKARELNINISSLLENALGEELKKRQEQDWKEENREAIEIYNRKIGEYGLFSDGTRSV